MNSAKRTAKKDIEKTIRRVSSDEEFCALKEAWNTLLAESPADNYFLRWEWLWYWWKAYKSEALELAILLLYSECGKLLGIAPFYLKKELWKGIYRRRCIYWLGTKAGSILSEYMDFIYREGHEEAVIEATLEFVESTNLADELMLQQVCLSSKSVGILKGASERRNLLYTETNMSRSPYILLPESNDAYLRSLGRSMRTKLRRDHSLLKTYKKSLFRTTKDTAELEADYKELVRLHQYRWEARRRPGAFSSSKFNAFQKMIMPEALKNGHLELNLLSIDGVNIAALYNINYKNKIYFIQSGLNRNFNSRLSPGILLHAHSIEAAITRGLSEYDFLVQGATDKYKTKLTQEYRCTIDLSLTRPTGLKLLKRIEIKARTVRQVYKRNRKSAASTPDKCSSTAAKPSRAAKTSKGIKFSVITTVNELKALHEEWDTLMAESYNNVMQLTHDWIMAWWDSFKEGKTLHIITMRSNENKLIAIAPMTLANVAYRGVNIRKLSLMANGQSPSSDIIISNGRHERVIDLLMTYLTKLTCWDLLEFTKVYEKSPTAEHVMRFIKSNNQLHSVKKNIESPIIKIEGDWESFFKKRSTKFRKSIRNKVNKTKRAGDITIERIKVERTSDPAVASMISISGRSWKKEIGNDMFSNPRVNNFYKQICDSTGPKGYITLWFLSQGTERIAFEFHLNYNGVVYPIRADYDTAYSKVSPGSILEYNIIKTLFEEGKCHEYNTCGHTYQYLVNWSIDTKQHVNIEIFNRSLKPYALYLFEHKILPLLRKLQINKVVKRARERVKK